MGMDRSSIEATVGGKEAKKKEMEDAEERRSPGKKQGKTNSDALDKDKLATANKMGKILGLGSALVDDANGSLDLGDLVANAQKILQKNADPSKTWQCNKTKEEIFKVWRTPKHMLTNDDEKNIFKLLQKYNGSYKAYIEAVQESDRRKANLAKAGSHIHFSKSHDVPTVDVDLRSRIVLKEIDRAAACKNEYMNSSVLHTNDQQFPTPVLRIQLEDELDRILAEQIKDRERAEKMRIDSDDSDGSDEEGEPDDLQLVNPDEEGDQSQAELLSKVKKRAKRREKRKLALTLKEPGIEEQVQKMKKKVGIKGKSGKALEEAQLMNQLGIGGCLACRTNPCKWKPSVDEAIVGDRKKLLDKELERVRLDKDSPVIESEVCLSAQLGGNKIFKRMDLLEELTAEATELARHLHLNAVDKELHDAYASRKEFCEVAQLHGYSMMLWTNNARVALEARQSRLVAVTVAKEAVDDIMDWMLEGWFFGERESSFNVLGK